MRNIVLRFDMRSAPECSDTASQRYAAALKMAQWADHNSIDVIGLSEHHNTPDGFLSSPLPLAAMMIARTQRVRISISALLVPLHEPLRLAEDIALLDIASGGRFSVTCGLGYRKNEYACFGIKWETRGQEFDDKLDILMTALTGETFSYNNTKVQLNPVPISALHALVMIGGNSYQAAIRAARLGLFFCPAIDDPKLEETYRAACEQRGVTHGFVISPRAPATTFISENPTACWEKIGRYLLYDAKSYAAWRHPSRRAYAESFANNMAELKAEGKYRIITPQEAIENIKTTGTLHLAPLTGGVPCDLGWRSLRLFEQQVQPYL